SRGERLHLRAAASRGHPREPENRHDQLRPACRPAQCRAPARAVRGTRAIRCAPRGSGSAQHHLPHERRPVLHHRFRIRHAPRWRRRQAGVAETHRPDMNADANQRPSAVPVELHWSGLTHVGRVRPNNEDAFLALNFDGHEVRFLGKTGQASPAGADFVFAVSDGLGGAKSGEFASRITVDRITKLFPRIFRLSAAGLASGYGDVLAELVSSIHRDLLQMGFAYEECAGMGATLSLAWFAPGWMYFAHVGDRRIYFLPRDGGLTQLTHDHTHVGWLRRKGELNERE